MPKIIPPPHIDKILSRLEVQGFEAWCVGGCVRDALLCREPSDWDIATAARPQETKACFPGLKLIETGIAHGTVTLITEQGPVEVTTYRVDGKYENHRRPAGVSFSRDINDDLSRRDFTVNAMAFHPGRGLLDPFGGQEDLQGHILRCVGSPSRRFDEDALRILRGVRFSAALGFRLEPDTLSAALENTGLIGTLSGERIQAELTKLILSPMAQAALERYGPIVLAALPELPRLPKLLDAPLCAIPRWAALLRDCPPDTARSLLSRLRFSNRDTAQILRLIRQLPLTPADESLSKRLYRAGLSASELAVSGGDLIGLGYSPGPHIGRALELLLQSVISGELPNQRDTLLDHARKIM